jgi:hypothetical protein
MKKLIAILAVFAFLGTALFAQDEGSWSVSSNGTIGTRIDFVPMFDEGGHATVVMRGPEDYHNNTEEVRGNLNIRYNKGGLSTGLNIRQHTGTFGGIIAVLSFNGENFQFAAEQTLNHLLTGVATNNRRVLWGNYTFQVLNGIKLEAAVAKDQGNQFATTDILGYNTYTHHDTIGNNYLLLDASPMEGLNLGFIMRRFFFAGESETTPPSTPPVLGNPADFLTESIQRTVLGAKYSTGPVGVAVQFALRGQGQTYKWDEDENDIVEDAKPINSALYLGLSYKINDQMSAGLEFRGEFGGQNVYLDTGATKPTIQDAAYIGIGAKFDFSQGPFGAGVSFQFKDDDRVDISTLSGPIAKEVYDHNQQIIISPSIRFDVVENYLRVQFDGEFTFYEAFKGPAVGDYESKLGYMVQPAIFFNFLGTGAGTWSTGFWFRWRIEGVAEAEAHTKNVLQLTFKWQF